jgi:hypothetical protein
MEEQTRTAEPPAPTVPAARTKDAAGPSGYSLMSGVFVVAAVIFAGKGWYTLYDNSYDARIVGGDAYNYIIYATRGTALVCIGIVCAVLSVTFAVFAQMAKRN